MGSDEPSLPRKLAAILYADVAGYSLLTGEDEEGTHRLLSEYLDIISATVRHYNGQVIHYAGDAVLVDFRTVSDALGCAASVQKELGIRNRDIPEGNRIQFRIGVNLGEVIVDRDDIYGDGVNVAARLESLAEPGGICISDSVHTAVGNKLPLDYEDIGTQSVKNIAKPIHAYQARVRPDAELPQPAAHAEFKPRLRTTFIGVLAIGIAVGGLLVWYQPWQLHEIPASTGNAMRSDKPSVAVLPFDNMSGDPGQDYFTDGITEDLTTDLSKISALFVIARNSAFTYKGSEASPQDVARDLGVRYVVEGSVRRAGDKIRVNVQLIDTRSGGQLWAERYDRKLHDIFLLQDDITQRIVAALSVKLSGEEKRYLATSMTNNFEAYDLFLQGRRRYSSFTEEGFNQAKELYRRAIGLDPQFTRAYSALAVTLVRLSMRGETDLPGETLARALELANRALSIDPSSAHAHRAQGFAYLIARQFDDALSALQRSVELAPNDGDSYAWLALINNYLGRGEEAVQMLNKAMQLNPRYSWDYKYNLGRAYYSMSEYAKAAEALQNALERNENSLSSRLYLAATYVRLKRQDDAEWEIMQIEVLDPDYTLSQLADSHPIQDEQLKNRLFGDLRTAGLPD